MADYEAISKVIRNAIRKEVDKQINAAYRRGYADGKARIEPTKTEKEYEEKQIEKSCDTCDNQNKTIGCSKHIDCQCNNFKHFEPKQTNSYRNNKYYNTFPTSKETTDEIKAEYDEETRSYTYTVDDNDEGEAE